MSERAPLLTDTTCSSSSTLAEPSSNTAGEESQHDDDDDSNTTPNISSFRGLTVIVAVFVLIFILTYGVSIITTIQSPIAADLRVTSSASWFISAYLIATTAVTPIAGKLCEIFSHRSYLLVSTVIQAIGLLLTAFAPSLRIFLAGRVVTGIGAAAITPVAFILVTELASRRRWGWLFGTVNCAYTAGVAIGAVIGGDLEPKIGWRAVFWTQAPVCLIVGLVAFFAIPLTSSSHAKLDYNDTRISQKLSRIDYSGNITLIGAVVMLLYALASPEVDTTAIILAVALLALFSLVESRWATEPIVPTDILCSRAVLMTGVATVGFMSARWEVLFYVPTYAIATRGWTQTEAGSLLIPTNFGFAVGSIVIGLVHIRKSGSYYVSCLVCFILFILEHFALSRLLVHDSSVWLLCAGLFVNGFIAGAVLSYNLVHLLHLTNPARHYVVIPLNAMFRSLSGSVASSLSGGIFVRALRSSLHQGFESRGISGKDELISQLLSRPLLVQQLPEPERAIAEASYATSIQHLFIMGCLCVIVMTVLQAFTGWTAPRLEENDAQPKSGPVEGNVAADVEAHTNER